MRKLGHFPRLPFAKPGGLSSGDVFIDDEHSSAT